MPLQASGALQKLAMDVGQKAISLGIARMMRRSRGIRRRGRKTLLPKGPSLGEEVEAVEEPEVEAEKAEAEEALTPQEAHHPPPHCCQQFKR